MYNLTLNLTILFELIVRHQLNYPEFSSKSEAKGDNLIGMHQTKTVKIEKMPTILTCALSGALGILSNWRRG